MDEQRPTHKVKTTECGRARKGDALTANWEHVSCPGCNNHRPATYDEMVSRGWPIVCHTPTWPPKK